jgi:L-rhamnose mutarotase
METAFGRIGQTDVNRRWGESFEGIITTIVGADGTLITAREVFHQD